MSNVYITEEDKKLSKLVDNFLKEVQLYSTRDVLYYLVKKLGETRRGILAQELIEYIK